MLLTDDWCFFLTLQLDNIWFWNHFLGKLALRILKDSRGKQHLAGSSWATNGSDPCDPEELLLCLPPLEHLGYWGVMGRDQ